MTAFWMQNALIQVQLTAFCIQNAVRDGAR